MGGYRRGISGYSNQFNQVFRTRLLGSPGRLRLTGYGFRPLAGLIRQRRRLGSVSRGRVALRYPPETAPEPLEAVHGKQFIPPSLA